MSKRKVEISEWVRPPAHENQRLPQRLEATGVGVFHQFGVDYEEFDEGAGNFSTAIVEMPDGTIKNVPVENIRFLDVAETEEEKSTIQRLQEDLRCMIEIASEADLTTLEWCGLNCEKQLRADKMIAAAQETLEVTS